MTVFVGVVMMLLVISLLATLLPASRVSKIDPLQALATECLYRPGPLRTTIAATA
jgi:ABC-type lipoprotein release transport system permease subunit